MGRETEPDNVWLEASRVAQSRFVDVDEDRLSRFIAVSLSLETSVPVRNFSALSDRSGISNGIAFFDTDFFDGAGPRALVLRTAPRVSLFQQKNCRDDFLTMRAVHAAGLPVPKVYCLDSDGSQLGVAGFVMDRADGEPPATAMYSRGPFANVDPETRRRMMLEPAGFHGRLRKAAIGAAEVPHLTVRGQGVSALERELNWWLREATLITEPTDSRYLRVLEIYDWLMTHQPADLREATLIHGDAQHCNIMFKDGRPAAVLDWEFAHLGYTETDLMMLVLTTEILKMTDKDVEGTPTEAEYIARYEEESGEAVEHWGYFKLVMSYRYLVGQISAASVMPNPEEMWRVVDSYVHDSMTLAQTEYNKKEQKVGV